MPSRLTLIGVSHPGSPLAHRTPVPVMRPQGGLTLIPDGVELGGRNVRSWWLKTTTFCVELTSHSPPPTPLLPALTPSAGEHQVSGGEFNWDCWLCLFGLCRALSLRSPSTLLHYLRRTGTVMARKKANPDELEASRRSDGYQRGARREEDSRRDGNKHGDTTKKNQDASLDHYVI